MSVGCRLEFENFFELESQLKLSKLFEIQTPEWTQPQQSTMNTRLKVKDNK